MSQSRLVVSRLCKCVKIAWHRGLSTVIGAHGGCRDLDHGFKAFVGLDLRFGDPSERFDLGEPVVSSMSAVRVDPAFRPL